MSITREAGYLYIYSKELIKMNKKLHKLSKEAHSHGQRHLQATDEKTRFKYAKKHRKAGEDLQDLVKKHHALLSRIKHHLVNYNHALRKELKQ